MINAIYSSDNNPLYKDFEPYVNLAWKRIDINPVYINISEKSEFFSPKVPLSTQSQLIRILYPSLFPEETFIISDIDMLPISKSYFKKYSSNINCNDIINLSSDAYDPKEKYYPMCYWVSKGKNFKKITGVRDAKDIPVIMEHWNSFGLGWNTDERYFSKLVNDFYNKKEINLILHKRGWKNDIAIKRIDRMRWSYDLNLLNQDYYIDAHMLRPLKENINGLQPIFNALKI